MLPKEQLKKRFSSQYARYYKVRLFDELGFVRKTCRCGKSFWTLDNERTVCPSQPCSDYAFIGRRITKKRDYVATWKAIERFFVKNKHTSVPSYPVVCRWFPGLYFTVASIVAFQRSLAGKTVFELPANPLVIPQACLRFNDIPNVGVTGRHLTNFVMIGQHSLYDGKNGYWKDTCVDLDYQLLTKAFRLKPHDIVFVEDIWLGPSAFGYSLEYFVHGLELGNAVFTEFLGTPESYTQMDTKVIDMGAGLERFTWLAQGTPTCYDAIFGPALKKLLKHVDYDRKFFLAYARIAGRLNLDEVRDIIAARSQLAKELGVSTDELVRKIAPVEAAYAIADHTKSLLLATADGALPSNVGGGYNLRVILRRALGFADEFNLAVDMADLAALHARYLKKLNPRLTEACDGLEAILSAEKKKFEETKQRTGKLVDSVLEKKIISADRLAELYESHGITPEILGRVAKDKGIDLRLPDVYSLLTERHMAERQEKGDLDLSGLPPTELLFYKDQSRGDFTATVLKILDGTHVVLDRTCFYGRAGGQEPDHGTLGGCRVYDAEKIGNVIVHAVENAAFTEGATVQGAVDMKRRMQLTQHHSATHLINYACRRVLGSHVWQHSAFKSEDKARIDITHFATLSGKEAAEIENVANAAASRKTRVITSFVPRSDAERKYGFSIYQGGAAPEKELRIVAIGTIDVEACSGTHVDSTAEVGEIMITRAERIQDGIVRLEFVAGAALAREKERQRQLVDECARILGTPRPKLLAAAQALFEGWKSSRKAQAPAGTVQLLASRMEGNVLVEKVNTDMRGLQELSKKLSADQRVVLLFGTKSPVCVFGSAGKNTTVDIGALVKRVCEQLGGKGGGTRWLAQGIVPRHDALDEAIRKVKRELHGR